MKRYALIGALVLFAGAAGAETVGENTGINSTLGIAPTTTDFVHEAAISDMFEIQSSQLAVDKLNGREKEFADQMIKDHTKTSTELKGLASEAHIDIPAAMDSSHQSMLDKLKGLSGDDFRKMYFSDQVSGHKDAVSLFDRYGKGGENAKIKTWASTTLPALQHHLGMAQDDYKNT
jgi:putative membrane protein